MDPDDPRGPGRVAAGFAAADRQPSGAVGQVCETCPDNWVEAGARDEQTGEPLTGLGYRVYDLSSGDRVAQGVLDDRGEGPRHWIPMASQQLYVVYGTDAAMDEAEGRIEEVRRQRALEMNARPDWHGIPAGLEEGAFHDAYDAQTERNGRRTQISRGFLTGAYHGATRIGHHLASPLDWDAAEQEYYLDERARAWDEYQLVTGAREASRWESFFGGSGQGASFGFGDEAMAGFDAMITSRTYEEAVDARRQIMEARRIANPGTFIGGEVAGAIPTVFVPVGGAVGRAVQAGRGARGAVAAGARTGAGTGALMGAGQDEGGPIDRLDGAALGGVTGGAAGAVTAGAGVLVARGVAKTRIWGRFSLNRGTGRLRPPARELLANEGRLIGAEQGLQSRTAGLFDDVVPGTHGDDAAKYLWTIDERGINIALEQTPFPTPRGNIVHTNLSSRASIGGEAWFGPNNAVTINAGSGRFGDGAGITERQWRAAARYWRRLGYDVDAIPYGSR
ncbi:hypothetical protein [Jannaschia sp. LMIT008]|uniref:hypothetical protein n=1 Tax=Jannaschia maritima TaxID=3032585 RepID=UPI002810CA6A|nr:hypothetical protein [Jannaschia sp. LMIT008]